MTGKEKITPKHLGRTAIIYIRQSTLAQVRDHRTSTERQYEQKTLAVELGWHEEQIEIIDEDLGKSATSSEHRSGFQALVTQVAMKKCGAILGTEVSRLSRSSADWYKLLELCALHDTLIIDNGLVHDPGSYDDRLLLGLKGTMADSEIHMMHFRLQGGRYRKALEGRFWSGHAPPGYVFGADDQLLKDPDERVRHSVEQLFRRYEQVGSVNGLVRAFSDRGIKFPIRRWRLQESHHIDWEPLRPGRARCILLNPVYAGTYSYGRKSKGKPRWTGSGPWPVVRENVVDPYITAAQFMKNQKRIQGNRSSSTTSGAPRRGNSLVQGIAYCGKCGRRMQVAYQGDAGKYFYYKCSVRAENGLSSTCFSVTGMPIDKAIACRVIDVLNQDNIERALEIAREVQKSRAQEQRDWKLKIEGAEYEAQRSFRQYNAVEPENRLVARTLEKAWNEKLEELERIKRSYEEWSQEYPSPLEGAEREKFLALLGDFEKVWDAPTTTQEERKALLRLFVKDVTLNRMGTEVTLGIRWCSGMTETLHVSNTKAAILPAIVEKVRSLSDDHGDDEIAEVLNREGYRTPKGRRFTVATVRWLREKNAIKKGHKGEEGYYTPSELAGLLEVSDTTVAKWCGEGTLPAERRGGGKGRYWIKLSPEDVHRLISQRKFNKHRN